ncbi:MAG: hypothetical protein OEZ06_03855 [Myxococcales bacterium]|nr:hypothetical protein [Myxococcales bacterium]
MTQSPTTRRPFAGWLVGAAALSLAVSFSQPAQAEVTLQNYAGNYTYAGTEAQGKAVMDKAMDEALSQLNTVMKLMVKKLLDARPNNRFIDKVMIGVAGDTIEIKMGDLDAVKTKNGKPVTMTREGRTGQVTHSFKGGKLMQTVAGEGGKIVNVMTLSSDGKTLHRDVTISSDRLQKPIKYRLSYTRK